MGQINTVTIHCRSLIRRLGLSPIISRTLAPVVLGRGRETRFAEEMLSTVQVGDVVWDVGANVGAYVGSFLDAVGTAGHVVAFEPAAACFQQLEQQYGYVTQVTLERMGLGRKTETRQLSLADDRAGTTHRIVDQHHGLRDSRESQSVQLVAGDEYWRQSGRTPNVIKIDVEGHEAEVLAGMTELLICREVRAVFCEVHFGLLEAAGDTLAPLRIERHFEQHGFHISWVDVSHLKGLRTAGNGH